MTAHEFLERMRSGDGFQQSPECVRCHKPLSESVTGKRRTGDGLVDDDCYFEMFGELLEKFPVRTARIRRG